MSTFYDLSSTLLLTRIEDFERVSILSMGSQMMMKCDDS